MGNFYVNYTVKSSDQKAVANALSGRTALVSPAVDGYVLVVDEESDQQDTAVIARLGQSLSRASGAAVLAVMNHDDDIFWYQLFDGGAMKDEYNSAPDYFSATAEPSGPKGGDAKLLSAAFGGKEAEIEAILRRAMPGDDAYTFEVERHLALAEALGLPVIGVGASYEYLTDEDDAEHLLGGLSLDDFIRTA